MSVSGGALGFNLWHLIYFSFFAVGKCDVCDGYSQDSLQDALHVSATPRGGTEAGTYTKGNKLNMVYYQLSKILVTCRRNAITEESQITVLNNDISISDCNHLFYMYLCLLS